MFGLNETSRAGKYPFCLGMKSPIRFSGPFVPGQAKHLKLFVQTGFPPSKPLFLDDIQCATPVFFREWLDKLIVPISM